MLKRCMNTVDEDPTRHRGQVMFNRRGGEERVSSILLKMGFVIPPRTVTSRQGL